MRSANYLLQQTDVRTDEVNFKGSFTHEKEEVAYTKNRNSILILYIRLYNPNHNIFRTQCLTRLD